MWEKFVSYFAHRHLLTNFIFIAVFLGGIFAWRGTSKEEMPDVSFDFMRVSASYPGATAEEVEHFVTKPIEEAIRGLDGIHSVRSSSNMGGSSVFIEIEHGYPDKAEVYTEIRNAVLDVNLPEDVVDEPEFRQFKTTTRAIIDVGLYNEDYHLLDSAGRIQLQTYALALENQLLNLPEVHSVSKSGYNRKEIQIKALPEKLVKYNIPFNTVMQEIKNSHVRQPAGSIEGAIETKVTITGELDEVSKLRGLVIQGGFEGNLIRLGEVAEVVESFEKNTTIRKINGHEGIFINVVKNSGSGILEAIDAVKKMVKTYEKNTLKGAGIKLVMLDDESVDLRNRLSIVKINGMIGFMLILASLFVFLNFRSGIWVALGIPFTLCFTLTAGKFLGFTINNITLAAIIIVMGMVVDDAIVVAENIIRMRTQGTDADTSVVKGTVYVLLPIVASITTTCVAFLPLYFFSGRFSAMVTFIPPVIMLMLGASLLESLIILPSHMKVDIPGYLKPVLSPARIPFIGKYFMNNKQSDNQNKSHWFNKVEDYYGSFLEKILPFKWAVILFFVLLLVGSLFLFRVTMKFVMFPNEETREVRLDAQAAAETNRFETAELSKDIDKVLRQYIGKEIIGIRSSIARGRRGGAVEENKMSMGIEILPKDERKKSANQLISEWEKKLEGAHKFKKITFSKSRWGQSSGSPIEVLIQENNDSVREKIALDVESALKKHDALKNIEIEQPLKYPECKIELKRDKIKRLGINPKSIGTTMRAILEGSILYKLTEGDEEVPVKFTAADRTKTSMKEILTVPVENKREYLVPLGDLVKVKEAVTPMAIEREDYKRTVKVFADIKEKSGLTPLDVAKHFEAGIFPDINAKYPTAIISFGGEVKDTRESQKDFLYGVILVVLFIYVIIALLFNSLLKPLIIMAAIPFGVVGIILAFLAHGMTLFGFFAGIGALGLAGVVVNDSIIMLVKLDKEYDRLSHKELSNKQVARIAQTRLKAVLLTTITTVAGLFPTAYGFAGYDALLAEMMLAMAWGLIFATLITLILIPCLYGLERDFKHFFTENFKRFYENA